MGNLAVKIAVMVIIINAVISFFNATGVVVLNFSANQIEQDKDVWQQMTDPTSQDSNIVSDIAKQGLYGGGLWMISFVYGFVYLKGLIDPLIMYTWPYTLATFILQGLIYVVVALGVIQFIANRRTI